MVHREETLNEKVRNQLSPITNLICLIERYGIDMDKAKEIHPDLNIDVLKRVINEAIPMSKESVNNIIKLTCVNGEDTEKNHYK